MSLLPFCASFISVITEKREDIQVPGRDAKHALTAQENGRKELQDGYQGGWKAAESVALSRPFQVERRRLFPRSSGQRANLALCVLSGSPKLPKVAKHSKPSLSLRQRH